MDCRMFSLEANHIGIMCMLLNDIEVINIQIFLMQMKNLICLALWLHIANVGILLFATLYVIIVFMSLAKARWIKKVAKPAHLNYTYSHSPFSPIPLRAMV